MIERKESLSMPEAAEYLNKEQHGETLAFIKEFTKLNVAKAKELRTKLEELNLIKLNREQISKLIEMLPETKEEMNKILSDTNLDEDETNNVLQTIKEFK